MGPWHNRDKNTHNSCELYLFKYDSALHLKKDFSYSQTQNFQVGTTMILLCIKAGIPVDLFGFDLEPMPRTHYYENRPEDCSICHNVTEEQKLIIKMREQGLLKVVKK